MTTHHALVVLVTFAVGATRLHAEKSGSWRTPKSSTTTEAALREAVRHLAGTIGERNLDRPEKLALAADWISSQWAGQGLRPVRHTYKFGRHEVSNLDVSVGEGTSKGIVLVGAHYDSVAGCPGADDNASGVAVMLQLSKALAASKNKLAIRCVAFVNEEPPYFMTEHMGSRVYAAECKKNGDDIRAMISLETMGYFSSKPKSQRYPSEIAKLYPSTGHFIGVAADTKNRVGVETLARLLRSYQTVSVESAAFPAELPGISWSDHASFWWQGYPGVMITDTAPYRNPHYHKETDTPDTLDYARLARVSDGLVKAVLDLANPR